MRSRVAPRTNSPGWRMNGSSPLTSTTSVRSSMGRFTSMKGYRALWKTRNTASTWRSTDEGWTQDGSKGSISIRPESISSRMVRSERIIGWALPSGGSLLSGSPPPLYSGLAADVVQWQNASFPSSRWGFDSPHPLDRTPGLRRLQETLPRPLVLALLGLVGLLLGSALGLVGLLLGSALGLVGLLLGSALGLVGLLLGSALDLLGLLLGSALGLLGGLLGLSGCLLRRALGLVLGLLGL